MLFFFPVALLSFLLLLLLLFPCLSVSFFRERKEQIREIETQQAKINFGLLFLLFLSFIDNTRAISESMSIFSEQLRSSVDRCSSHSTLSKKTIIFSYIIFVPTSKDIPFSLPSTFFFSFILHCIYIEEKKKKEGQWRQAVTCCCFCCY